MKSWRFHGTNKPFTLDEVEEPHAGPGEVVVKVKAAGVCHSDVAAMEDPGWMPMFFRLPMTMGHENAGVITEVGVIGLGGLGFIGARTAVLLGAEVYAAEVSPETRKLADEIGLAGVAESITEFKDKGLELIVDYAGFGTTTASAIETLAEFGMLVQVGMGRLEATINTYPLIINQLTVRGSKSGTKEDLLALYDLMRSGELNPPMNLITQADIPAALEKLRKGGVIGRFVAQYPD